MANYNINMYICTPKTGACEIVFIRNAHFPVGVNSGN